MKTLSRSFEVKKLDKDTGKFSGYGSVFGTKDSYGDVVEPGAFAASLKAWRGKGQMPALLWQHQMGEPIGKWTEMAEDDRGLYVEGQLALKTTRGAEAHELLKMDALRGLSIGYAIPKDGGAWDPQAKVFRLKQVDLWEVSLVTFPANEDAQVEAVKSAIASPREFERFLRDAGLSRRQAQALMADGFKGLADGAELDLELAGAELQALSRALREGHCAR
jgi:Escherichia/Staphylococcus phage prohead protease